MAHTMRAFFSIILGLVVLAILGGIGAGVYNAGVAAGLAQAGAVGAGAVAPYVYGWGFHPFFGFGFLGLLFPLLFLFLIFGLIRAALGAGRRSPGQGWGPGWGHGWGHGWGDRDQYIAQMHRRLHEAEGTKPDEPSGGSTPAGSSDQTR
jgi:hypothetical protein